MNIFKILSILLTINVGTALADEINLSSQLDELKIPSNTAPAGVTQEKLYSVQNRYLKLDKKFEFSLGVAKNFTGNSFLQMNQINAGVAYHLNDRWSVMASGSYGFNDFTESARMVIRDGFVPDAAVVKWRSDLLLGYNLFYGKFRMSMDQVFYFDQYVSIGPGLIKTQYMMAPAAVADVGFALWFGDKWSARFGAKSDIYREKTTTTNDLAYHLLGHIDVGYLLGGNDRAYE